MAVPKRLFVPFLFWLFLTGCAVMPSPTATRPQPTPAPATPALPTDAPASPPPTLPAASPTLPTGTPAPGTSTLSPLSPTLVSPTVEATRPPPASTVPISGPTRVPATLPPGIPIVVLAENLPNPDDLLLAPDGSVYLSDIGDGTVRRLTSDGKLSLVVGGLQEPEGMLILPDRSLLIMEQGKNRLVRYDFAANKLSPFLTLENKTRQLGADNILLDNRAPGPSTILVPDSPNGRLLRISLDGQTVVEIARGFVRPTAVWAEPGGSLLVVDEFGDTLKRVLPSGRVELIAAIHQPDDVVQDSAGNIYVNTLDGGIHLFPAGSSRDTLLLRGLGMPQGLCLDADGNLLVTEPGRHRLIKLVLH